jgi:signal transduction histidine kinase
MVDSWADSWGELWRTPVRMRAYLALAATAAIVLPVLLSAPVNTPYPSDVFTAAALFAVSVLNVEVSRWLSGGIADTQQPHKALSAWAFATAMLLPTWWLLVIVPVTYAHARWRGIRVPLWKWAGSACYLILAGLAAGVLRQEFMGSSAHWTKGDGSWGAPVMLLAVVVFLAVETVLFWGSVAFNSAEDEVWLKAQLSSIGFYATEGGVILLGALFAVVWSAGWWFSWFFVPIHILIQHVVLLAPLRERAAVANELAENNRRLEALNHTLERTNTELDQANQFKTDLMGMLGHELGNPLTSVLGYVELGAEAVEEDDRETARAAFEVIDRNTQKVAAVLADIVHLVASDRGVLTATPEPVVLAPRLHAAVAELPADRQPSLDCATDLTVMVQPGHLDQILGNLLSNAEKYAGGATLLTVDLDPDDQVRITVADQGAGVPADFVGRLFERYSRERSTSTKVKGTGLGLYISRELARANGGELRYEPGEPHGSRFVLQLPPGRDRSARDGSRDPGRARQVVRETGAR